MSVMEVKDQLRALSSAQRQEVTAFLFDLQAEENEGAELSRLHAEMDGGKHVSLADCLMQHEALLSSGR